MSLQLLGNRLIVIPLDPIDTTPGGIYLPETVRQDRNTGIVALIGNTVDPAFLQRKVIFNRIDGEKITIEGLDGFLLYCHDIKAFVS